MSDYNNGGGPWSLPTARVLIPADQLLTDRAAWMDARRAGVTATDQRVLSGHGYAGESRYRLWRFKTDPEFTTEEPGAAADEDARLELGTAIEPVIREFASRHLGVQVRRVGMLQHRDDPTLLASPDGLTSDGGLLEAKMVGPSQLREDDPAGARTNQAGWVLPAKYEDQVRHQMLVAGKGHAHVAALVVGAHERFFTYWRVDRDTGLEERYLEQASEFWAAVVTGTPPPPDWDDDDEPRLRWPVAAPLRRALSDPGELAHVEQLLTDRATLAAEVKEYEDALRSIDNQLRGVAGDFAQVIHPTDMVKATRKEGRAKPRVLFSWQNTTRTTLDTAALAAAHPGIDLAAFQVKTPGRRLSVPKPRGAEVQAIEGDTA
jgi:predicted phage-related endonuclease